MRPFHTYMVKAPGSGAFFYKLLPHKKVDFIRKKDIIHTQTKIIHRSLK